MAATAQQIAAKILQQHLNGNAKPASPLTAFSTSGDEARKPAEEPPAEDDVKVEKTALELIMEQLKPSKSGKKRNYSRIDISADKWFLTLDPDAFRRLAEPPSLADGLGIKEEKVNLFLFPCV